MMARVVYFEITADDMDRAEQFYREAFGWEISKWQGPMDYRRITTTAGSESQGIDGALMGRAHGQSVINTIAVEDLPAAIARVTAAGGSLVNEVQDLPGVGEFVYARDTEGNVFGLMQPVSSGEAPGAEN